MQNNIVIETVQGARLPGILQSYGEGSLTLETPYAGVIKIPLEQIKVAEFMGIYEIIMDSGEEHFGVLQITEEGDALVKTAEDEKNLSMDNVLDIHSANSLQSAATELSASAEKKESEADDKKKEEEKVVADTGTEASDGDEPGPDDIFPPFSRSAISQVIHPSDWLVEGGINLSGRDGSNDQFNTAVTLDIKIESDYDRLNVYGKYEYGTNNNQVSSDETVGGFRYTNFTYDKLGWFVRQEFERDQFAGIYLRSTTASGGTYRFKNTEKLSFEVRGGFSYRYENYMLNGSESFPGLDLGADLEWMLPRSITLKSQVTYLPSVSSIDDFILEQNTSLNFPLEGVESWKLRLGISNQYRSEQVRETIFDTSYYARLIFSWK